MRAKLDTTINTDTNECEQEPYPCDESAICYNTDGSFYCECKEGFSGDGFECTGNDNLLIGVIMELHTNIPQLASFPGHSHFK